MPCDNYDCDCGRDRHEKCPKKCPCDCEVEAEVQRACDIDLNCALKVLATVHPGYVGGIKIYMIDIVLKNCTNTIFEYLCGSLDLGCAGFIVECCQSSDGSQQCQTVIGLNKLDQDCLCKVLDTCLEGGLPVNKFWNGVTTNSDALGCQLLGAGPTVDLTGCDLTQLFAQPLAGCPGPNVMLPPGETRLKARIIANAGDLHIMKPILTVGAYIPCCGPIRVSQAVDTGDCLPEDYMADTCLPEPQPGCVETKACTTVTFPTH